jgi:hypothetical protein
MRLPKSFFVLRSLLLTTLSFGVSGDRSVRVQDDNSAKWMRLAQASVNRSENASGQIRLGMETRKSLQTGSVLPHCIRKALGYSGSLGTANSRGPSFSCEQHIRMTGMRALNGASALA